MEVMGSRGLGCMGSRGGCQGVVGEGVVVLRGGGCQEGGGKGGGVKGVEWLGLGVVEV